MSWCFSSIGNHVEKISTWNPCQSLDSDAFRYIDLSSVDKDKKVISQTDVLLINPTEAPSRARQLVKTKDVLVATVRPNLNGVAIVPDEFEGATASTGYCVLRADNSTLDSRYLYYWVRTDSFVKDMVAKATGANYPAVSDKIIKESKIPLPPLAEQKRIAAILDKADSLRRKRQQAIQLADQFLRAVFLDMFGDPVMNPKGWEVRTLSTLVSKLGDGLHGTPKYDDNGEYFFINGNNLNNGKIEINDSVKKVNKVEFEKHKKDLNERTMLVSINGTIGKVAYYRGEKILLGKSACYFNIIPEYVSDVYLFHLIQSNYFFHYTGSVFTGSTIKNVSLKSMREFPVPLPPKYIQEEFVAKAIKIEKMKKRICYSLAEQQKIFESLSQKAFAGEL